MLKPLHEENARELEIVADVLEWAVICLKENGRQADLEARTLYTIVLEEILEKHSIWKCPKYRDQSTEEKWKVAKKFGLCYRCLGEH